MFLHTGFYSSRSAFQNFNFGKILTLLSLMAATMSASASSTLNSVSCAVSNYSAPATDACSVQFTSIVGSRTHVTLTSNNPAVIVPAAVTVRSGASSSAFQATIASVKALQTATITAQSGTTTQSFQITVTPAGGVAALTLSTSSVSFGNVSVGLTGTQAVTLISSGTAPVTVSSISIVGSLFGATGVATPLTLSPGQTATMTLTFSPVQPSPGYNYTGILTLSGNAPTATMNMSGAGIAAAPSVNAVSCSNTSITGTLADTCTLSLSGPAPNGGQTVNLASNSSSVTVPASITIPAGSTNALFTAGVASVTTAQSATLTATCGSTSKSVSLQLNAAMPVLTLNTSTVSFGNVSVGSTGTQSVTLTSSGTAPVTISALSVAGSLFGATGFVTPLTLNPGQTATMTVTFSPVQPSPGYSYTGIATITSNAPAATVNMSGAGVAVTPTVRAVSCTSASITGSLADTCTVSLSGAAPSGGLTVSLASSSGAVTVPASVTVPANATSTNFVANAASVSTGQLVSLTATLGSTCATVSLQLGAATQVLTLQSTSIGFGNVFVNTPVAQPITLTSTGSAPVTVNSTTVSGTGFSVSGTTLPTTLNPGQSLTLDVQFDPATAGSFAGQMTIATSATSATVSLSGVGESHEVEIVWSSPATSSDPVVSYNVYRAPSGSTSYQLLNRTVQTPTSFLDDTVQSGAVYDYVVKSVDALGVESAVSNTATVAIP